MRRKLSGELSCVTQCRRCAHHAKISVRSNRGALTVNHSTCGILLLLGLEISAATSRGLACGLLPPQLIHAFSIDGHFLFCFLERYTHFFGWRAPKMELPTRTLVDPIRAAISKSCDIPMLSSKSVADTDNAALTACRQSMRHCANGRVNRGASFLNNVPESPSLGAHLERLLSLNL